MKAMILAAGMGTRLHPLTEKRPKALIPVMNRPMIARVIDHLKSHGADEIIVNAHHHGKMLMDYLADWSRFAVRIEARFEPEILGTGGGIRNTADFWEGSPFIVANADTLTDIDLTAALTAHKAGGALATLIVHNRPRFSKIQMDEEGRIADISRDVTPGRLAFTGIQILEPEIMEFIRPGVFSDIIDCYRELIRIGRPPRAFSAEGHRWHDIGTIESYLRVHEELCMDMPSSGGYFLAHDGKWGGTGSIESELRDTGDPGRLKAAQKQPCGSSRLVMGSGCMIHPSARVSEWAVLGEGTVIEEGSFVSRSVLWDGVRVKPGVKVVGSVISSGCVVARDLDGAVL